MDRYDERSRYCRMLGHEVHFSYCRAPGSDVFCRMIASCWGDRIDIQSYLTQFFTAEQQRRAFATPKPKVASLLELVDKARQD